MRVCMINDNFYRSSGVAIAIRRISQALHDVDVCFAGCDSEGLREDLSWIPTGRYARFDLKSKNPARVVSELSRFKCWVGEQDCDLVHCHHRRLSSLLQWCGVPMLYTAHLAFPFAPWFRLVHPHRMTAVTASVAANLLENTGTPALACIGNPVPFPDVPPPIAISSVRNRAVCVARLDEVKGHAHLIAACKILSDRGIRHCLDLVGEGPLLPDLQAQARRDGIADLVFFHGFTADVARVVGGSLFAILASSVEGQGIVTLEAAALGRASLLTAVPGSIDLIPPNRQLTNGIRFGDVEGLADAIEEWFSQPQQVIREGVIFFDFLKPTSDPDAIATRYKKVYRSILGPSGATDPLSHGEGSMSVI